MKKARLILTYLMLFTLLFSLSHAQAQTKKVLFQGFWWDYENSNYPNGWANYITELAPRLNAMGIDAIWIPPSIKNQNFGAPGVGYAPFDHYDLGDKFQKTSAGTRLGTKDELLRMIAVLHANGIEVVQDIVPNHVIGAGSDSGAGGTDPAAQNDQFKNFRYSCYSTPAVNQTAADYLARAGRFPKNHQNFHPNIAGHNCSSGDICSAFFGPDVCYLNGAYGQSSNATYNPAQYPDYMQNETRNWLIWYKKQTGFDGVRMDAVKHYDFGASEDFLFNLQYNAGFASGGEEMFAVGEYVGGTADVDGWYSAVQGRAGVFDFNLRAFDGSGGLYNMVYGFGNYNMASLPGAQQTAANRINGTVHKTVPFINNHDTFRPQLNSSGNYIGWNTSDELSAHIEPNEPRLATAYAVIMAMDGNPQIFFEDLFDIGYNGNRYSHVPSSSAGLPTRDDIVNLIQCHQKLNFKDGAYKVRSAEAGLFTVTGSTADHLVIERSGQAVIGITDNWDTVQEVFVDTDFPQGTVLMDYSGANGLVTYTVPADQRVRIITQPVNPALNAAGRHGYSVWAPVPGNSPFGSTSAMYAYLASYSLSPITTTQEWEMADDLGDNNCSSLMQGGALPAGSTNQRVVGRIFTEIGNAVTYEVFSDLGENIVIVFYDNDGNELHTDTGGNGMSGSFTAGYTGWINMKIRNATTANGKQTCYVKITYDGPTSVNTGAYTTAMTKSIWTGNGNDSDITNCQNWEQGKIPDATTDIIIPAYSSPAPVITGTLLANNIVIEAGTSLEINGTLEVHGDFTNNGTLNGCGTVKFAGNNMQTATGSTTFCILEVDNSNNVTLSGENTVTQELRFTNGKYLLDGANLIIRPAATVTGYDTNRYVETSSNASATGFLIRSAGSSDGNVVFPVGNELYNPVTLNNGGSTRNFFVRIFDGVLANGTSGANIEAGAEVGKSWVIEADGTGVDVQVQLQWDGSQEGAGFNRNQAAVVKNNGADWVPQSSSAVIGSNPYTITANDITSFSSFAVFSGILPVELLYFTATKSGQYARLSWTTASEINNQGFYIEKSNDGVQFVTIGFIDGSGNSFGKQDYQYIDRDFKENSYYRLLQVDFDGKTAYSQLAFLAKDKDSGAFTIAPNPFADKFSILANNNFDTNSELTYRLTTLDGKIIAEGRDQLGNIENIVNRQLMNRNTGVYWLVLNDELLQLLKD